MLGIREKAVGIILFFYKLIFKEKPGHIATVFMKDLGFITLGVVIAKTLSIFFNVYAGRILGPLEYGKFGLVSSFSQMLWVPMMFGIGTAMVKYLSEEKSEDGRRGIISTGIYMVSAFTVISSLLLWAISPYMAQWFSVGTTYVIAGIVLAVFITTWTLTQKIYQGIGKMKKISYTQAILNVILSVSLVIMLFYSSTALVPVASFIIGYFIISLFVLPEARKYLGGGFDKDMAKSLLWYGFIIMLGTISFSVNENINKIFLNMFLTLKDVGLYQAYYFSTLNFANLMLSAFVMVFFPMAAKHEDKKNIMSKISKMLKLTPLSFIALLIISWVIIFLYGSSYSPSIPLLSLFVVASILAFVFFIYTWFSSSISIEGVKITTLSTFIVAILCVVLSYILVQSMGIYGAIISTIISYSGGIVVSFACIRRLIGREKKKQEGG